MWAGSQRQSEPHHPGRTSAVKVPVESLSESALAAIIEAFVLREGTDYGPVEYDLEDKCRAVRRQLDRGEAELDFDPVTETVDIRPL